MTPLHPPPPADFSHMEIQRISAAQARTIRKDVLRPGRPDAESIYPNDDAASTLHLGAFDGERLVGAATFLAEECVRHVGVPAWRLRGMAVIESLRDRGLGGRLLSQGIASASHAGIEIVWCNGRVPARSFYERHGFRAIGEEFCIPVSGPHYLFVLRVRA